MATRSESTRRSAREITALIREARALRGSDDHARRAEYFTRKEAMLRDLQPPPPRDQPT